jgi:CO dehydrogenase maturation factor
MKIAFVGKGGSGKTTLASLIAKYIAEQNLPALVIDADINQHLAHTLGMPKEEASKLPPLGIEINRVKEYLRGTNPLISSNAAMIKTTPPGRGSRLIRFNEKNPIFDYFEKNIGGVRIMAVGEFTEEDLGIKCYHSKVGAVELLLNHLIDREREYLLVDMTAGADSFASGMFTKFDLTLLIVEPTLKSMSVYKQYKNYAKDYGVNVKIIGNKIEDESDLDFIQKEIGNDLIAVVKRSGYIRALEKGNRLPITELENENRDALGLIVSEIDRCSKDWQKFYQHAVHFHIKNAKSWANAAVGEDVSIQVDPSFNIKEVLA